MNITDNYRSLSRENNFDVIRFIAASAVIFSHSYDLTGVKSEEPFRLFTNGFLSIGTVSVYIFFIISGFLIQQSFDRSKSLNQYVRARALRIFPGLIVVTFITAFFVGPFVTSFPLVSYFTNPETYRYLLNSLSLKMFFQLPGVFLGNPIQNFVNGSIWSLPYEILFYCLIALYALVRSLKFKQASIVLAYIIALWVAIGIGKTGGLLHNTIFFIAGILFYKFRNRIPLNLPLIFISAITLVLALRFSFENHLRSLVICFSLAYFLISISFIKGPLNNFTKTGDYSYGLYIWGCLVQQLLIHFFKSMNHFENFIFGLLFTLPLAFLSWHLIEKKALKLKKKQITTPDSGVPLVIDSTTKVSPIMP